MNIDEMGHGTWETAHKIEHLGMQMADYSVTIFEDPPHQLGRSSRRAGAGLADPSKLALLEDPTARIVVGWAARNSRVHVILGNGRLTSQRTERLAFCRNVLMSEVAHGRRRRRAGAVVMMDLDCKPSLTPMVFHKAMAHVIHAQGGLGMHVLTANAVPYYYDFWSARILCMPHYYDC